jgi:hypothetical protein
MTISDFLLTNYLPSFLAFSLLRARSRLFNCTCFTHLSQLLKFWGMAAPKWARCAHFLSSHFSASIQQSVWTGGTTISTTVEPLSTFPNASSYGIRCLAPMSRPKASPRSAWTDGSMCILRSWDWLVESHRPRDHKCHRVGTQFSTLLD